MSPLVVDKNTVVDRHNHVDRTRVNLVLGDNADVGRRERRARFVDREHVLHIGMRQAKRAARRPPESVRKPSIALSVADTSFTCTSSTAPLVMSKRRITCSSLGIRDRLSSG